MIEILHTINPMHPCILQSMSHQTIDADVCVGFRPPQAAHFIMLKHCKAVVFHQCSGHLNCVVQKPVFEDHCHCYSKRRIDGHDTNYMI